MLSRFWHSRCVRVAFVKDAVRVGNLGGVRALEWLVQKRGVLVGGGGLGGTLGGGGAIWRTVCF